MTYVITTMLSLAVITLAFQNCSSEVAFTDFSSQSVIPLCRDITAEEVSPKLKWSWEPQLDKANPENYPGFLQVMATPMVADLDGDRKPEVVFVSWSVQGPHFPDTTGSSYTRNGVLRIVNGATGATIKSIGEQELAPAAFTSPLLADLDGDGQVEIIYSHYSGQTVVALNSDGSKRWTHQTATSIKSQMSLSAIDLDEDGKAEVLLADEIIGETSNRTPVRRVALQNSSTVRNFAYSLDPSNPQVVSIIGPSGVHDKMGNLKFALNPSMEYAAADLFEDVEGLEIVGSGNGAMAIYNGLTGQSLKSIDLRPINDLTCSDGRIGGGPPTIGDFDGIPETTEVAVATGRYLIVMNEELEVISKFETQDCSSLKTGISSFDFNGDKKPEILYGDEEYLRIFEMRNGQLNVVHKIVNPSGTLNEYPVVADIDGNGSSELLVASNNYAVNGFYLDPTEAADREAARAITGVRAFESAQADSWMPTRPIWHQFNFNPAMVSDAGTVFSFIPVGIGFTDKIFRRNAQLSVIEQTCKK